MLDVPIVIIFFNRPDCLSELWKIIEIIRPTKLIAISDGFSNKDDAELVRLSRNIVKPNWACDFIPLYRNENLGLRDNVVTGLNTVFLEFPEAIVLEDDCIPHPSFFPYCEKLLEKYRDDNSVFSITGTNQFSGRYPWNSKSDYAFSRYFSTWGWAAWRRSWQLCDWDILPSWTSSLKQDLYGKSVHNDTWKHWRRLLVNEKKRSLNWGYQCAITALANDQSTIFPRNNAIRNIGLNSGVHFKNKNKIWKWRLAEVKSLPRELFDPEEIIYDDKYDALLEGRHFDPIPLRRIFRKIIFG